MTRRLIVSAAVGAVVPLGFAFGFLLAAPLAQVAVSLASRITAAVLRRIEDNHKTSSKGEVA